MQVYYVYFLVPEYAFIVIAAYFRNKPLLKHSILMSYIEL